MNMAPRYAIYFVPAAETPLYRFGTAVLGYDAYTGERAALIAGVDAASWNEVVREPRVYGFHATLKAPFRLAEGVQEVDLLQAVAGFSADQPAVLGGELAPRTLGSFIALVPSMPRPAIDQLAQVCVQAFDRFRAPMSLEERARRLTSPLSERQLAHLERWGYPHVFEDFRFHMTLTGSLASPEREHIFQLLCTKFEQETAAHTLLVDRIVVARQSMKGVPFQVIHSAALGQSAHRPFAYSC